VIPALQQWSDTLTRYHNFKAALARMLLGEATEAEIETVPEERLVKLVYK
jgi:hypothetical protein